jgi:hypothetical protein
VQILVAVVALASIVLVLRDVVETVLLPRRVSRRYRITRLVYGLTWRPAAFVARRFLSTARREGFLAYYGPLALLLLLVTWAIVLVVGYAALQWAAGSEITAPEGAPSFGTDLYFSATTFFTLGLGDIVPRSSTARVLAVIEVANGFGLIALVIGYMPALYQAFSRREVNISLLDARAGSPPTAGEILRRLDGNVNSPELAVFLREWERWSAELMESLLSYPSLAYFRSQHDNQSWVAAITAILDVCAFILACPDGKATHQARLTFAMARHAAVDLSQVYALRPPARDRLSSDEWWRLTRIVGSGQTTPVLAEVETRLRQIRALYEPYTNVLAEHLLMPTPPWLPTSSAFDDWQTSAASHGSVGADDYTVGNLPL